MSSMIVPRRLECDCSNLKVEHRLDIFLIAWIAAGSASILTQHCEWPD